MLYSCFSRKCGWAEQWANCSAPLWAPGLTVGAYLPFMNSQLCRVSQRLACKEPLWINKLSPAEGGRGNTRFVWWKQFFNSWQNMKGNILHVFALFWGTVTISEELKKVRLHNLPSVSGVQDFPGGLNLLFQDPNLSPSFLYSEFLHFYECHSHRAEDSFL